MHEVLPLKPSRKTSFQRFTRGTVVEKEESIIVESTMELWLEDMHLSSFVCSPGYEKELALGFLLSSGIIRKSSDISFTEIEQHRCVITSKRKSDLVRSFLVSKSHPKYLARITPSEVKDSTPIDFSFLDARIKTMMSRQPLHDETGATHAALIHEIGGSSEFIVEDIGRHNAVDKAIGYIAAAGIELDKCMLLVTGRLTSELVGKAAGCGIPFMGSFAFATDMGIQLAVNADITLLGSLKREEFWIYNQGMRFPFQN